MAIMQLISKLFEMAQKLSGKKNWMGITAKSNKWHHVWMGKVLSALVVSVDSEWCPSGKAGNKISLCDREDTPWHFNHGENGFIKGVKSRIKNTWLVVGIIDLGFMLATEGPRFGDFIAARLSQNSRIYFQHGIFSFGTSQVMTPLSGQFLEYFSLFETFQFKHLWFPNSCFV